jgi:single-stranded-DNA-specific exonuclease
MTPDSDIRLRKSQPCEDRLPADMHPVIRRILLARGIATPSQLELGLGQLSSPASLLGLGEAAQILSRAIRQDQHILIVGDFDADGATGTALAVRALRAMGAAHVDFRVPNRFEFGYGLTEALVDSLAQGIPDVLVTVDSGISCLAGVSKAKQLGCTVIVTDHHLPGEQLPQADAIVNPNVPGDTFPSKALAGVGVMFYLLSAVRSRLRASDWFGPSRAEPNLANYLDLVALGTVADLVPLDHNNRILVQQGMARIRSGRGSSGLMALLRAGKRDYRHLVAADLAFAVAPRLNAAGRLEDMSVGIRCLLSDDPVEATELAAGLDELNRSRRGMQQQMQEEASVQLDEVLAGLKGQALPFSLCLHDPSWHQGIVGLVASRIKDHIHRPVVVFAPERDGSDVLKGSARSVPGLHIRDVLAHVEARNPEMMMAFGGHAMAAGLTMKAGHLPRFSAALEESVNEFLGGKPPSAEIHTDGELGAGEINLRFATELRELGPWGQHFPEPLFDGFFQVINHRVVGGSHLKMIVRPVNGGEPVDAIAFGRSPEHLPASGPVRLLYRLDVNHFRGDRICQLMVERILSGPLV